MQPHASPNHDGPPDRAALEPGTSERIRAAFRAEERAGQALAARARIIVLLVAGVLLALLERPPDLYYYEAVVLALAVLGAAQHQLALRGHRYAGFIFVSLDAAVIVLSLVILPAALREDGPAQLALRTAPVAYLFLLMAYVAVSYSPAMMIWAGVSAALAWALGVAWVLSQPGTVLDGARSAGAGGGFLDPGFVDLGMRIEEIAALLMCAAILAFVVRRSRKLVIREAGAARERANLARYFSPTVVDQLAGRDEPLGPVRRRDVAVLFGDIVGFTTLAETTAPEDVLDMLREFHGRMEREVFSHHGTLEKFIGDALLATFGVPDAGEHDAADALACAYAMQTSLQAWNEERTARGQAPLRLGVGGHFGRVVIGDIGTARNMAFAVVGDTVNTASRLQALTRTLDCDIVVSDALVAAVRRDDVPPEVLLGRLVEGGDQVLRGRGEPVRVWCVGPTAGTLAGREFPQATAAAFQEANG